jgi:hypothetical protein
MMNETVGGRDRCRFGREQQPDLLVRSTTYRWWLVSGEGVRKEECRREGAPTAPLL